jgi:hypothetical protein
MTQPSSIDFRLPESSLLFAARSSPFICIADTLEIIIELFMHAFYKRNIRQAAKIILWRRAHHRSVQEMSILEVEIEQSSAEKHPHAFLILFIVTLMQATKIFGLQGLIWTKIWAGVYLCSYVVLALIQFLAPKDWKDDPPLILFQENEKLPTVMKELLFNSAAFFHAYVCVWFFYQIIHCDEDWTGSVFHSRGVLKVILIEVAIYFLMYVLYTLVCLVLDCLGLMFIHYILSKGPPWGILCRQQRTFNSDSHFLDHLFDGVDEDYPTLRYLLIFGSGSFLSGWAGFHGLLDPLSYNHDNIPSPLSTLGGGACIACFGLLLGLLTLSTFLSSKISFLRPLKLADDISPCLVVFPFFNFLVAFLYYRNVYDARGTFKPAWTENLG